MYYRQSVCAGTMVESENWDRRRLFSSKNFRSFLLLYRGITGSLMKMLPCTSIGYVVYEELCKSLGVRMTYWHFTMYVPMCIILLFIISVYNKILQIKWISDGIRMKPHMLHGTLTYLPMFVHIFVVYIISNPYTIQCKMYNVIIIIIVGDYYNIL